MCNMLLSSDSSSGNRPMSLSRCASGNASAELQFAISDPTPGLQNSCPQDTFAVDLHLCLLTPSEWIWVSPLGWGGRGRGGVRADLNFPWDGRGMLLGTLLPPSCERGRAGGELVQTPVCRWDGGHTANPRAASLTAPACAYMKVAMYFI